MHVETTSLINQVKLCSTSTQWRETYKARLDDDQETILADEVMLFSPIDEALQRKLVKFFHPRIAIACGSYGDDMTLLLAQCHKDGKGIAVIHICFRRREGKTVR